MEKQKTISFAVLFSYIKQIVNLGLLHWKQLLILGLVGGVLGFTIASVKKPKYVARLSFILNENESGGGINLSSLAGLAGLGGMTGPNQVNEDKLQFISQSRKIIGTTLLSKMEIEGRADFFANHFLEIYKMVPGFKSDTSLENFTRFEHGHLDSLSYAENKVLDKIIIIITKGNMYFLDAKKKSGIVSQNAGILSLSFTSINEQLSLKFVELLYQHLSRFYTQKTVQRQTQNYQLIKDRADSIQSLLYEKENYGASYFDKNLGVIKMQGRLELERTKRDVELLGLMYAEVLKNQEMARFALDNQTPVFQVIDSPTLPLEKIKLSRLYTAIAGAIILGILGFIWFVVKKFDQIVVTE